MPRIYRIMREEGGKPKAGSRFGELGVRPGKDIPVHEGGLVQPGEGGMSVGPSLLDLPVMLVPKRLRHIVRGARGTNSHRCWRMGDGSYEAGRVAQGLRLRIAKDEIHGFVEPSARVSIEEYQRALTATREHWVAEED